MFPLVRVLWRSVWVLVAVQVWVSQFLVLGLGVVGWLLLGVGARHSWLRARWRLFASRAGVLGYAVGGGALGVTGCRGRGGGGRGVVGDGVGVADGEGAIGDTWWSACVVVVCWRGCCWCWCWARPAFGWSAVPGVSLVAGGWSVCGPGWVVPVVSGVGEVGAVGGWRLRCVAAVGGVGDGVGEGAAGGAVGNVEGEGTVGDALVAGGVLTVGVGPRNSWRRYPWASLARVLAPFVLLMSMVLYRAVLPWRRPLTLWVVVAEVALSVAVSVMPVVRSLRALLWFTASLMLLMLLVVGVGLCVGGQRPVLRGGRWLVSVALSGRVCSRWSGLLMMLLV